MVILVVYRVAQIVRLVFVGIIHAVEVVLHVFILAVFVAVVEGSNHSELAVAQFPAASQRARQLQVAQRTHRPYAPVVVKTVVQQVDTVAGNAVHRGVYAAVESAHAAVETEEVGARTLGILEVGE